MATVLVIDDEKLSRLTLRKILEHVGHEVFEAANGIEGIAAVRAQPCDIVITDIIMPEKEGITTIIELKRDFPRIPVIAISGGGRTGNLDLLVLAKRYGAHTTLAKPFSQHQVLDAIAAALPEQACVSHAGVRGFDAGPARRLAPSRFPA